MLKSPRRVNEFQLEVLHIEPSHVPTWQEQHHVEIRVRDCAFCPVAVSRRDLYRVGAFLAEPKILV